MCTGAQTKYLHKLSKTSIYLYLHEGAPLGSFSALIDILFPAFTSNLISKYIRDYLVLNIKSSIVIGVN